ncbi:MAG: 4Fe-4S ferredoxin [Bacteroidales bacterium]|nr:4Fe-4S ferredoxin [Bacteroidales bacterium]MCF8389841.1 4Fe-4S ferredoxin [Bacteroidales bacterium]
MEREIVKIDEELCDGCAECIPNCHEGALQIIDGKARLISDLMCDGLGACLGHCPQGAISIEKREAEAYNEVKVIKLMVEKGENTVIAHMNHLLDHNETGFFNEALKYLTENEKNLPFSLQKVTAAIEKLSPEKPLPKQQFHVMPQKGGGCPGSQAMSFKPAQESQNVSQGHDAPSELGQWPVQMHLINPQAAYFQGADVVLAADCVAYSMGNFHQKNLKGKSLAILCPKLDTGMDSYIEKIRSMIDDAKINTLHLMIMQVPCCGGLRRMVEIAQQQASRKVPVKQSIVSIKGEILSEDWI